jgi:sugar/nucleoside kinase (ribokinase family)
MLQSKLDAVVIGCVGIDTNIFLYGRDVDWQVEANFSENLDCVGQAGGYVARGFAKLGCRTAFVGYVGEDFMGRFIREELHLDGIDTSGIFIDAKGSNRSVNVMYRDGRRKNFYDGKDNFSLKPDIKLCTAILARTRLAHFNIPNWARYLLPIAREMDVKISCDLQDIVTADDPYRHDFIDYADVVFFSAVNFSDPAAIIHKLLRGNAHRIVIAGMGARGCALGTTYGIRFLPPVDLPTPVVDTNGAGDALAVGFLTSYFLDKYSLPEALLRGQLAARHKCTIKASSAHMITKTQLDQYYEEKKAK